MISEASDGSRSFFTLFLLFSFPAFDLLIVRPGIFALLLAFSIASNKEEGKAQKLDGPFHTAKVGHRRDLFLIE
jgi:hypothetical protein